jgi:hypothetical protein
MAVWSLESGAWSLEPEALAGSGQGGAWINLGARPARALPFRVACIAYTADGHGGSLSSLSYACSAPAIVGPDDSLQLLRLPLPLPSAPLLSLAIDLGLQLAIDTNTSIDCRQDGFDPAPPAAIRGHQDA